MKRHLLFFLCLICSCEVFSQQLYSAATEDPANRFNPGVSSLGNPRIVFDDISIPSATVSARDSIRVTKIKVGIRRLANAPATNVLLYYTPYDDTATMYNTLIKIPPVFLGSVSLPANGATSVTEIVSLGDSVNTLFRLRVDTGNVYTSNFTFFLGVGFSNPDQNNGVRFATGTQNDDAIWIYNADSSVKRFATYFGGTPPAQFYMQVFGYSSGPFPVAITGFSGRKEGINNVLSWTTSSESNNRGFEIERSADGKNFSSIGFIASKADNGTSNAQINYSYSDEKAMPGTNFYRLKQVDKDGKFSYSSVVSLKGEKGLQISAIYPNPVKGDLNLAVSSLLGEKASIIISDATGKIVLQANKLLIPGDNNINLNVSSLTAGMYSIRLVVNNEVRTTQFVKN